MQGLLELADLPYVGAGVLASSISMDKEMMKRVAKERGLPVVEYAIVSLQRDVELGIRFPDVCEAGESWILGWHLKGPEPRGAASGHRIGEGIRS